MIKSIELMKLLETIKDDERTSTMSDSPECLEDDSEYVKIISAIYESELSHLFDNKECNIHDLESQIQYF